MGTSLIAKVRDVLVDIDYPAGKEEILDHAATHGGDPDTLRSLRAIPPVDYRNTDEILASIGGHPDEIRGIDR